VEPHVILKVKNTLVKYHSVYLQSC